MQEKSYSKKSYTDNTLEEESINLLEWDSLKTHLSSFASTEMGKRSILSFVIPSEYEACKRLLNETIEINCWREACFTYRFYCMKIDIFLAKFRKNILNYKIKFWSN